MKTTTVRIEDDKLGRVDKLAKELSHESEQRPC